MELQAATQRLRCRPPAAFPLSNWRKPYPMARRRANQYVRQPVHADGDAQVFVCFVQRAAGLAAESQAGVREELGLGFGHSNFRYAAPIGRDWTVNDLSGVRIATAYPVLLQRFLGESGIKADVVKLVLDRMTDPEWIQIAIRPAKPIAIAHVDGVPLLGLPGNPVSSLVSCELSARPALQHHLHARAVRRPHAKVCSSIRLHLGSHWQTAL